MLSTRQLRYFEALSRHLHFGRAAEECAVTQPALSMQIRDMEADLGVDLVERGRGSVRLTPMGEETAVRAREILASLTDLERSIRAQGSLLEGRLRLGVIPSVAPYLLPRLLPAVGQAYPRVELALRETQTEQLVAELLNGSLDLLILSLPVEHPALETRALFDDAFLLALPEGAELPEGDLATPDHLAPDDLLLLEDGHCFRDQALQVCGAMDQRRLRRFGATSLSTLVQLVANGQGVTLLPEMLVACEGGQIPRVRLVRFPEPAPRRSIGMVWRRSSPFVRDIAAFARLVEGCRPTA
ncbi:MULTISPECIES: hydrogen peroxide-inducible genes activator [Azorhizobium]|uniref:Regulatory protein n=1 Tax=Azorhizobium caulinodans (strain ATCC 43989 / DSM 5975 / JCM 20966 / LMG 6465 / NBRC 14845 / NCIMB 13405 / ORS 571) TaxID=438753 RepID=A8HSB3_AZOC5|nr:MULTISPECIES: hydrogen peroxide-inducible genes activator [Azorhizobium]TDU00537.1 LysR family hydrogen peroxide-inducible transcriptional activator [Azorhizobium sp. AG788]BAF90160.1 regulatory protein [Azorhizobium caulinodans ORS 571]